MFDFFIYILAISLQVSGALLLLIKSLSTKKEDLIIRFKGNGNIYKDNNTNNKVEDRLVCNGIRLSACTNFIFIKEGEVG